MFINRHPVKEVVSPALRCVGNLVTGDDVQTQVSSDTVVICKPAVVITPNYSCNLRGYLAESSLIKYEKLSHMIFLRDFAIPEKQCKTHFTLYHKHGKIC